MSASFQLLDAPWIPVEAQGGEVREIGLLELFRDAHEIKRVTHFSPVVTVSLYRLVFAIYHRAVPIESPSQWGEVWDEGGHFNQVSTYLEQWRHRFDLFDEKAPFWQVPDMTEEHGVMSWAKLAVERNDNNNAVLFDHSLSGKPGTADFATMARLLVATQMISVGAGNSATGYNVHSLIANTLVIIPEGNNLAETIVANAQLSSGENDAPIWEQPVWLVQQIKSLNAEKYFKPVTGLAERLTWPTRAIKLLVNEDGATVSHIHFGVGIKPEPANDNRDPWVGYRVAKDGTWTQQRLRPDRAIWRDLHALVVESERDEYEAAIVMQNLRTLAAEAEERPVPTNWTVLVGGQAADKAKIEGWAQERWRVPERVLHAPHLARIPRVAMLEAEEVRRELYRIGFRLIGDSVAPDRKLDASEQRALTEALPTEPAFWAALEPHFTVFLNQLGLNEPDADVVALNTWRLALITALREARRVTHQALGRSAHEIRAWARTEPLFYRIERNIRARIAEGEIHERATNGAH